MLQKGMVRLLQILCVLMTTVGYQLSTAKETGASSDQPNILFLFADDLTYEAVHAFGHTDIDTPNLDRLVKKGTTFSHAYNMGSWSGAVCVASRTMLITGRSVWDANRVYAKTDNERKAGVLWPQLLHAAGYQTFMTGKWHIRSDAEKCFDVVRHVRPGMPKTVASSYNRPPAEGPDSWSPFDRSLGGFWEGGKHWSEVTADDAIEFLSDSEASEKPGFFYVAFNAPHDPRQSPQGYVSNYPLDRIEIPEPFLEEYPYASEMGAGPSLRDEKLAPFPRTKKAIKVHRSEYYAIISHLDAQIGRILDALDQSKKAKDTWIFFTADHGLSVGHHGLVGKQNQYDHSVRVPFVVVGPGVDAARTISAPIYLQDVMPTTLELAGVAQPKHVFFHSLLPLLQDKRHVSSYESIYGAYLNLQRAITHDGWKLIVYPEANAFRLYHVAEDPTESIDLATEPRHAGRVRDLLGRLAGLQQQLGDAQEPFRESQN